MGVVRCVAVCGGGRLNGSLSVVWCIITTVIDG